MKGVSLQILLVYVFLVGSSNLHGQNASHSFYYPLHIGDFWEYTQSPGFRETLEVVDDTLMPNGHLYSVLEHEVHGFKSVSFQRVSDENELFQIDQFGTDEFLRFKLNIKVGDIWNFSVDSVDVGFFKVTRLSDTTLWAHRFKYAVIEDFTLPDSLEPLAPNDYFLGDSIGVFFHGFEGGFSELKGAIINGKKFGVITTVEGEEQILPMSLVLKQNYPNPFNSETRIDFEIPEPAFVAIKVYNTLGQEVTTLLENKLMTGTYSITWDGKDHKGRLVSTGIYIYILQHDTNGQRLSLAKKLLMLR